MGDELLKYPRTPHLEGSRLGPGDEDLACVPFARLVGRHVVVEEKLDGANSGVSFDDAGALRLQSRGHFLVGGPRERQFDLLKQWACCHQRALQQVLGHRYVMYGEWLYARHTIYYDRLPHFFLEFDLLDRETGAFLSTARRREVLRGLPIASVPVLHEGVPARPATLPGLVGPALYKGPRWCEALREAALETGQDPARVAGESDPTDLAEGLYVKIEEEGRVLGRFKWVRAGFLAAVQDSGSHWQERPLLPNRLRDGVDLFAE